LVIYENVKFAVIHLRKYFQVIPSAVTEIKKPGEEKITVDELSDPNIGDSSMAFRFTKPGIDTKEYLIIFVKKDVYEQLDMSGTVTDYESLKQLATIAAAKIK
jgi:hypothetical protein